MTRWGDAESLEPRLWDAEYRAWKDDQTKEDNKHVLNAEPTLCGFQTGAVIGIVIGLAAAWAVGRRFF